MPAEAAEARLAQAMRLSEKSPGEFVDARLPTMFSLPVAQQDREAFRAAIEAFHPIGLRAMANASAESVRDVLDHVDVPTLLVYGARDERAPLAVGHDWDGAIPSCRNS